MNFRGLIGILLIAFGVYLFLGDPAKAEWPARIGRSAVQFIANCVHYMPFSAIVALVLGAACLMMVRKY